MMQYEKNGSSENIMEMDLESEEKMSFRKGHQYRRKNSILVFLAAVCVFIFMVMTLVNLLHQQRKFSELESWIYSHTSNITSISSHLQTTDEKGMFDIQAWMTNLTSSLSSITSKQKENLQKMERQQDLTNAEVKSLSSAVSALASKIDASVSNQDQKRAEIKNTLESLQSSVTYLQSDLQSKQSDFDSLSSSMIEMKSSVSDLTSSVTALSSKLSATKLDVSQTTEVKSLINSLSSAVSALNNAVNDQKEKQAETERSLESLKSAVQSDQQNKQRDMDSLSSSMSELKSSASDLTSSVTALSSQLSAAMEQQEVKSLMNSLSSAVSALTSKLSETEERILNALKGLMSNTSAKTADVPVKSCKSGWIVYKSSCFFFSETQVSWSEARDYCKQQEASLLKIQDDNEEWSFLKNHTIPKHYWVGLTDQNTGQWRWVDETPYSINKERWNQGQPDDWKNHGLGEEGEDCGHISYTGKLNDIHCSTKIRFICRN
nr:C-type lectin domain family 10 member A isoform X2 [Danio rerio]|eukprot:XP_021327240.1 C-type lectin domain family 10 member A isoform X2 [Danio rerio]